MTNFRELLKAHCINGAQLARKMGVSRERISLWARGETKPRPANMKKIAEIVNVPYNEVMEIFYGEHTAV
jgi:transcriptional regulator with XRE-family HTH domain